MLPSVTIIIPTYKGATWLEESLPVLTSQDYAGEYSILAVDSTSPDNTVELLEQYDVRVIPIPKEAFSHGYARNLGVRHAESDLVVFISQDVLPTDNQWLTKLVAVMEDETVGAAYARQLPRPDATPLTEFFHQMLYPAGTRYDYWPDEGTPLTFDRLFFSNVCSITRRELILRHPFPEDIIMSEDYAYAREVMQEGYAKVYAGDVEVIHSHHYSMKTLFRRSFDCAYSLRGLTEDSMNNTANNGIRYLSAEVLYLLRRRQWRWLLYMPFYESARVFGTALGRHAEMLPLQIRIPLSLHQRYWTDVVPRRQA